MAWRVRERRAEGRALLGVSDGHAMRGDGHAEVARRVRKAVLHEQARRRDRAPAPRRRSAFSRGELAVFEGDVVRDRRTSGSSGWACAVKPGRALLEDEAGDAAAALRLVGARRTRRPTGASCAFEMKTLRPFSTQLVAALLGAASGSRRRDRSRPRAR